MRRLWCVALLVSTACASAPVTRPNPVASLAEADRLRLDGCYECLLDARDRYREAAVGANRLRARLREFETELLIALREREFALDAENALDRARAIAPELPLSIEALRYVELVAAVPHRGAGWSRRDAAAFRQAHANVLRDLDGSAAWVRSGTLAPAVRDYLARSLECAATSPLTTAPSGPVPTPSPPANSPLARYREATCRSVDAAAIVELRNAVPRLVEASYYIGELAVRAIAQPNSPNPHQLVDQVRRRLPDSPMVAFLAARLKQAVGDCEGAVSAFANLVALSPQHEDGWLGRVTCLTDLYRHADAAAAATHMIDGGFDNADEARYWRAWNLHVLGDLPRARADIDEARRRRQNAGILSLAGAIEHDQQELDAAERDLRAAQRMGSGKVCRAYWYLGSTLLKRQALDDALQTFESSMRCYAEDVAARERVLETALTNAAVDAEFRRVQSARLREEIRLQRHQEHASALNMANIHLVRRELDRASSLLEIAARDPQLERDVALLRTEMQRIAAVTK